MYSACLVTVHLYFSSITGRPNTHASIRFDFRPVLPGFLCFTNTGLALFPLRFGWIVVGMTWYMLSLFTRINWGASGISETGP